MLASFAHSPFGAAVANIIITDVVVTIVMVIFIAIMKIMPAKDIAFAHCPSAPHCPYYFRAVSFGFGFAVAGFC